jgi:hypothetical protein
MNDVSAWRKILFSCFQKWTNFGVNKQRYGLKWEADVQPGELSLLLSSPERAVVTLFQPTLCSNPYIIIMSSITPPTTPTGSGLKRATDLMGLHANSVNIARRWSIQNEHDLLQEDLYGMLSLRLVQMNVVTALIIFSFSCNI